MFCLSALAFVGCVPGEEDDNKGNGGNKSLILVADKSTIYDNGVDAATFTLYYDGLILTEGYEIYLGDGVIEGNTFTSTQQGSFEFQASHGTVLSNIVTVNVVATPLILFADLTTLSFFSFVTINAFDSTLRFLSIVLIFFVLISSKTSSSRTMISFALTFELRADFIASFLTFLLRVYL